MDLAFFANLCVAGAIAYFTWRMVQVQTYPSVLVYVEPSPSSPSTIQIIVKNVGNGIARNVRFTLSRPLPERAWMQKRKASDGPPEPMTTGPLVHGIPALGPGCTRTINWGDYDDVAKSLGDQPVAISCDFEHHYTVLGFEVSKKQSSGGVLEVASLLYTAANPCLEARTAMALESIARQFERVGDWGRPFRVSVESMPTNQGKEEEAA